jgi:hypothetical protein
VKKQSKTGDLTMGQVYQMKEACVFVGGNGTKAGSVKAGGCTRAWLESKGMNPSSLFGPNGSCIFQDTSENLVIGMTGVINGTVGQFSGIEPGMVARIYWGTTGMYEVTAVGSQGQSITFGGWDQGLQDIFEIYIGGAYNSLSSAIYINAGNFNCYILSNKDETITATIDLRFNMGYSYRNTWVKTIGYKQNLYLRNGRIVSDMDPGEVYYRSAEKIMQDGIETGHKITIDGSGFSGIALSYRMDNVEMRNFRIVGNSGGNCLQPASGTALQHTGLVLKGCVFEGGQNGLYSNGLLDFVTCEDCYAASSITGWGFYVQDTLGNGRSVAYNDCIADGCGSAFAASNGLIDGCIGRNNSVGMMINGEIQVRNSLLYNCTGSAFKCNSILARWHIWNTIAVMSNTAQYGIFHVQASGGIIVYEDYNCFVKLDGTAAVYHYSGEWPSCYSPSLIGVHTLVQEPRFMDAANKDFCLRPNSPCLNAGRPTLCSGVTSIGVQQKMQIPPRNVMYMNNRQYGEGNRAY